MKVNITYNNGFGKIQAEEKDGKIYVKRTQWLRAWQKVTNPESGLGGGWAELTFDTDKEVIQIKNK